MVEDARVKIDGKLETYKGDFTINILDMIRNLDDETKKSLLWDEGWWPFVSEEMAKSITNEFSRDSWSPIYTKLRGMILNSESMPKVITEWAKSLIESRERAKEREKYWNQAYYDLSSWIRERLRDSTLRIEIPDLPKDSYGKLYTELLLKEVEEKIAEWKNLFPDKEKA